MLRLITALLLSYSTFISAGELHYALNLEIQPEQRQLRGELQLRADNTETINLALPAKTILTLPPATAKRSKHTGNNLRLHLKANQLFKLQYQVTLNNDTRNMLNADDAILTGHWYPQPNRSAIYSFSAKLPTGFLATSEAEQVITQQSNGDTWFHFNYPHPLQRLHLLASRDYTLHTAQYNDIQIEAYFFKDDARLAESYLQYTQRYLAMYEEMLSPYPFQRFAIVANRFTTGYAMPTYTLLGSQVIRLPFIVETSLGHEILHQWFGSLVKIDYVTGNWAEGLVTYLADQHYAELKGEGADYRKNSLLTYQAYVHGEQQMPVKRFVTRSNKAESAVGYGKTAMVFHMLRQQIGDEAFFQGLRHLIANHRHQVVDWQAIQQSFAKASPSAELQPFFQQWLERQDVPQIHVSNADLRMVQGQMQLRFSLEQRNQPPYQLRVPIQVKTDLGTQTHHVDFIQARQQFHLTLETVPNQIMLDANYDLMRDLNPAEAPPILASLLGQPKVLAVVSSADQDRYQPLIDALNLSAVELRDPEQITFAELRDNSLIIAGVDNPLFASLFGKTTLVSDNVQPLQLQLHKNPYNPEERVLLLQKHHEADLSGHLRRVAHYGKYSSLTLRDDKRFSRAISDSVEGIEVYQRPPLQVLEPQQAQNLPDILPRLLDAAIIYVGEQHDQFAHHLNQLLIIQKLHQADDKPLAIGLEMFQRRYQSVLDDFVAGRIDERQMLLQSEYFKRWGYDYNLYKPILDYAHQHSIPLVALNMESEITRKVSRQGLHALDTPEQKLLPALIDVSNPQYREDLQQIFSLHGFHGGRDANYFLQAQLMWDETMAESIDRFMQDHLDHRMVVIAGNGHVRHHYGIPDRVKRRNGLPSVTIVQDERVAEGIADFVLFTSRIQGQKPPMLGVTLRTDNNRLVVERVTPDSPAAKAGLQKGDQLLRLAENPLNSMEELKIALFYADFATNHQLAVKRGGKQVTMGVQF